MGRLGCRLGVKIVLSPSVALVFLKKHFLDVKTIRRRSWDQLWPTKAPKRPKMTPKTEPKSTPRRSKIDIKIDTKNDAKSKRAQVVLGRRHWAGTPWEAPPKSKFSFHLFLDVTWFSAHKSSLAGLFCGFDRPEMCAILVRNFWSTFHVERPN